MSIPSLFQGTCPPGTGGTNCTSATCQNPFVAPASRITKAAGSNCLCTDGFVGTSVSADSPSTMLPNPCWSSDIPSSPQCNVCTSAQSCKSGLVAAAATQLTTSSNSELTCHQQPSELLGAIWMQWSCLLNSDNICSLCLQMQSRQHSCLAKSISALSSSPHPQPQQFFELPCLASPIRPTFSAIFPGDFEIEITKVKEPDNTSLTGLPHWTDQSGITTSSIFLDGVEQFYCQATGCSEGNTTTPVVSGSTAGTSEWTCSTLQCYCIPGTRVCTPTNAVDGRQIINGLNGTLSMPCDYLAEGATTSRCNFKGALLKSFLGDAGLPLEDCKFGSCLTEGQLEQSWRADGNATAASAELTGGEGTVSGSVIAGLVVLAVVIVALVGLGLFGWRARGREAKRPRSAPAKALGLQWTDVTYSLPQPKSVLSTLRQRRRRHDTSLERGAEMVELGAALPPRAESLASDEPLPQILCGVSGELAPGSFQAMLGVSGAGKSTLCDILCGRTKRGTIGGSITLFEASDADRSLLPPQTLSKRPIAFVDQHDELPALMTVREALSFAARLSLPENIPTSEQDVIVDDVIVELGLERVANRKIGDEMKRGVSGGERRRVSIGLALVGQPQILIADEPLSGLDSVSAEKVMSALRSRADGTSSARLSAIMSLHQPSSEQYHSFDSITLLGPGGRAIYHGTPANSIDWCEAQGEPCPRGHNVADHLLRLASGPNAHLLSALPLSRKTSEPIATNAPLEPRSLPSLPTFAHLDAQPTRPFSHPAKIDPVSTPYTQIQTLLRRSYLTASRDPAGPLSHILGAIGIGLFVGGAFFQVNLSIGGFQNRVGSIFFTLILMAFASMSATTILSRTRPLMIRERASHFYQPWAFFVAHLLWDLIVLRIVPALLLMIVTYWMVGLHASAKRFFEYLLIGVVYHCVMAVYDMLLGALFQDPSIPILLSGFWILFNLSFAGFLLNTSNLPSVLKWVRWIAPMRYALEAMASNELEGLTIKDSLNGLPIDTPVETINPSLFNFQPEYYRNLLVLALAFLLGLAFLLHEAIFYRMRERR